MGVGTAAGKDAWLAILVGILMSLPALFIYGRLLSLFSGKNLYEILEAVFGKVIGKGISLFYLWFAFHLGSLVLRNFGEFVTTVSLPQTPRAFPMLVLILICSWGVRDGIEVLGKWGKVSLLILLPLIFMTILFMIPLYEIDRLRPVLSKGLKPVLMAAFSDFTFPFAETVIFTLVLTSFENKKQTYGVFFLGLAIGGLTVLCTTLAELLVLGEHQYTALYFPSYSAVRRLNIGNFFQRVEIITGIAFFGAGYIKISMCLMGACKGFGSILNLEDYRFLVLPMGLLMLNMAWLVYDSQMEMFEWAFSTWSYYAFFFQAILPAFILIGAELKKRKINGKGLQVNE